MGLDIGFNIYEKKKDEKGGITLEEEKIPEDKEYETWSCGRCAVNYSWGYGSSYTSDLITRPTFDEELDGYKIPQTEEDKKYGYTPVNLKYIPFKEFKAAVSDAINEAYNDGLSEKRAMFQKIAENVKEIKELREWQKGCTEKNKYAFDRWEDRIQELKSENAELNSNIDTYDEDDYDVSHAKHLDKILKYLEECQDKGYVCIPWYSD